MTVVEVKMESPRPRKSWRSVSLGNVNARTGRDYLIPLMSVGCVVTKEAGEMLRSPHFEVGEVARTLELSRVFPRDLGFKGKLHDPREVLDRALARGLGLCPHSLVPEKCLQSRHLRKGERLVVAMKPIKVDSLLLVFDLRIDNANQPWMGARSSELLLTAGDELLVVQL